MKIIFLIGFLCICTFVNSNTIQPVDEQLNQIIRNALEDIRGDMKTGVRGSGRILSPMTIHKDDTGFNVGAIFW